MAALASAVAIAAGTARWRLRLVTVTSGSMEPSLLAGDELLVVRCAPGAVRRGDVVLALLPPAGYAVTLLGPVDDATPASSTGAQRDRRALPDPRHGFRPSDDFPDRFVKRVVALPGDLLQEADVLKMLAPGRPVPDDLPHNWLIPPHSCFVLGDGTESADSLVWGPIPLPLVLGRAVARRPARGASGWSRVPPSPWRHG